MEAAANPQPQAPQTNKDRVRLNPFAHLAKGVKQFFKTNTASGLLAIALASLANLVMVAALFAILFVSTSDVINPSRQNIVSFLVKIIVAMVVFSIVGGYFNSVMTRVIVAGVRGKKESLSTAMKLVWARLPKIILTYMALIGIIVGFGIFIGVFSAVSPILGLLLTLVALVGGFILMFRLFYIGFVLVDDEPVIGPRQVFARSSALSKKSVGAILLYVLVLVVLYVLLSAFSNGNPGRNNTYSSSDFSSSSSSFNYDDFSADDSTFDADDQVPRENDFNNLQDELTKDTGLNDKAGFTALIAAYFVYVFASNFIGALISMGMASIYKDARQLADGSDRPTAAASAAPVAPTAA